MFLVLLFPGASLVLLGLVRSNAVLCCPTLLQRNCTDGNWPDGRAGASHPMFLGEGREGVTLTTLILVSKQVGGCGLAEARTWDVAEWGHCSCTSDAPSWRFQFLIPASASRTSLLSVCFTSNERLCLAIASCAFLPRLAVCTDSERLSQFYPGAVFQPLISPHKREGIHPRLHWGNTS